MKVINPGLVLVKFTVSHDMSKYHPYARIVIVLNFLHLRTYICIGCIEIWLPGMVNYIMDVPLAIVLILQMWWSNALLQITDYRSNGLTGAPLRRVRRGEGHDSRGADSLRRWPEVKGCWGQRNSFSLSQPEQWTSSANALLVLWDMILDLQLLDCKLISLCYLKKCFKCITKFSDNLSTYKQETNTPGCTTLAENDDKTPMSYHEMRHLPPNTSWKKAWTVQQSWRGKAQQTEGYTLLSKHPKTLDMKGTKTNRHRDYTVWLTPGVLSPIKLLSHWVLPKTKIPSVLPKTLRCSIFLSVQKSHL